MKEQYCLVWEVALGYFWHFCVGALMFLCVFPVTTDQKQVQADKIAQFEMIRRQMEEEREKRRAIIAQVCLHFLL